MRFRKTGFILLALAGLFMASCEILEQAAAELGLSDEEVVQGLLTALEVGTDSSSTQLSAVDGYYGNALLKIPLPAEALQVQQYITDIKGLDNPITTTLLGLLDVNSYYEKISLSVNRAAEDAAEEAAPVFKEAISGISFSDAWAILQGSNPADSSTAKSGVAEFDSTAATGYFKTMTKATLMTIYGSKIDAALDKPLGSLNVSANGVWGQFRTAVNKAQEKVNSNLVTQISYGVFVSSYPQYALPEVKNETIGAYCTDKALDGLFYLVGEQEKKIRRDPWAWALDILQRVFGSSEA